MNGAKLLPGTPHAGLDERIYAFADFVGCTYFGARIVIEARGDVFEKSVVRLADEGVAEFRRYLFRETA